MFSFKEREVVNSLESSEDSSSSAQLVYPGVRPRDSSEEEEEADGKIEEREENIEIIESDQEDDVRRYSFILFDFVTPGTFSD